MNRIGLIQLSDLQFGSKHRFGYPSSIAKMLIVDILAQAKRHDFVPTYLLLTGDISETGHGNEFADAQKQIELLREGVAIDAADVLAIPGNHDVSWELAKLATAVGNESLKLVNFREFKGRIAAGGHTATIGSYPIVYDQRNALQFILVDSCERETHEIHRGYVSVDKLLASLRYLDELQSEEKNSLRICLLHHRLDVASGALETAVENYEEVEAIALHNGVHIVLTGHVHQSDRVVIERDGRRMLKSGSGSVGVQSVQRLDGVGNQYSIFVVDRKLKKVETISRLYSPTLRTQHGVGGWVNDNSIDELPAFDIPFVRTYSYLSQDIIQDARLIEALGIVSNPFTFNNAEKISPEIVLQLFVSDGARHKEAKRLTGDAIIRGPRGAGKTMYLRFLDIFGSMQFLQCLGDRRTAECFPVFVRFSGLHSSEIESSPQSLFEAADRLIHDSIVSALDDAVEQYRQPAFAEAVRRFKTRLDQTRNVPGTRIKKLGGAIQECLSGYFKHILLLMDEVATIFPKAFFLSAASPFVGWMNEIRNSGPFFTRVAVYPSDDSDVLNEERFGTVINLEYNVRSQEEYVSFYQYCAEVANKYLRQYSKNQESPADVYSIIQRHERPEADALEQLVYASDGSTRRFLALMDRCLSVCAATSTSGRAKPLSKDQVLGVIKTYASNLVSSYPESDRQLAEGIAKICRKRVTFRFKAPGMSLDLQPLYAAREEFNIVKVCDAGSGRRGTVYEFTYPYCILNDIQTHYLRDSERVDYNRSYVSADWITTASRIERSELDGQKGTRAKGTIVDVDRELCVVAIEGSTMEVMGDAPLIAKKGDRVSFYLRNGNASDVTVVG